MPEWGSTDEQNILNRLRDGDKLVLSQLFRSNLGTVKFFVMRNNGKPEDAEDLLQESLLVVWKNISKPDFQLNSKMSTYIMAICKNLWYKQLQKSKRIDYLEEIPDNQLDENLNQQKLDLVKVTELMDQIGDTCKEILAMFYFDGADMQQIADRLNFANTDTAKAKKYQCFKKLQEIVTQRYKKQDFFN